ncbi:DUF4878 domain-containing protein [Gordonia phosphorivorans]|uniref:DUF4878 domain-containing protein n=1 Tax=Gordonia phosphorivorans TaxID=1056982 RepID=A0ABV6H6Q4_9ACTN
MQKTLRKPVLAVTTLAAGAAIALTGCSSDSVDSATSTVKSAAASATDQIKEAVDGLDDAQAQEILRTAVDPATPADQIDSVVDVTDPATKTAIIAYGKGSSAAGYTPDVYTVKSVESTDKIDGNSAATVTVAVKSPHVPQPIDLTLTYVEVDGTWKLSGDAVTQLAGMGR